MKWLWMGLLAMAAMTGTANAALNLQAVTAGSVVGANLQGYAGP